MTINENVTIILKFVHPANYSIILGTTYYKVQSVLSEQ